MRNNRARNTDLIFEQYWNLILRDAKQFTGLEHCQARSRNKLHFPINASLPAARIDKCTQRNGIRKNLSIHYSISDVKTELFNPDYSLDYLLPAYAAASADRQGKTAANTGT